MNGEVRAAREKTVDYDEGDPAQTFFFIARRWRLAAVSLLLRLLATRRILVSWTRNPLRPLATPVAEAEAEAQFPLLVSRPLANHRCLDSLWAPARRS